jgi:hypothetical protein
MCAHDKRYSGARLQGPEAMVWFMNERSNLLEAKQERHDRRKGAHEQTNTQPIVEGYGLNEGQKNTGAEEGHTYSPVVTSDSKNDGALLFHRRVARSTSAVPVHLKRTCLCVTALDGPVTLDAADHGPRVAARFRSRALAHRFCPADGTLEK